MFKRRNDQIAIVQGLGKSMAGKLVRKTSRQEVCVGRSLQMSKGCEDIGVPRTCSSNVTSGKEEFNNRADRMTHSLDIQSLSQAIPAIAQWAHKRAAMVTKMGFTTQTATHQG